MLSEKEKHYIKMSDIAAITKEKVEDARAEGKLANQHDIALNMLARSMDISLISELTGLSEDEVSELKKTSGRS